MFLFGYDTKIAGCFMSFHLPTSWGRGASMKLPNGLLLPTTDPAEPFVVTGIQYSQKDKYHLVQCFRDTVHTYAFGHDPANSLISVQLVTFLVDTHGQQKSTAVSTINNQYNANRLSANPNYCEVYLGDGVLKGFLVGMTSSTQDSNYNLQRVTLDLLAVEVQGTTEGTGGNEPVESQNEPGTTAAGATGAAAGGSSTTSIKGNNKLSYPLGHLVAQGGHLVKPGGHIVPGTPTASQYAASIAAHKK